MATKTTKRISFNLTVNELNDIIASGLRIKRNFPTYTNVKLEIGGQEVWPGKTVEFWIDYVEETEA